MNFAYSELILYVGFDPLFVGTQAFEIIVQQQIRRLENPSLKCCQLVYDGLIRVLSQLLVKIVCLFRNGRMSVSTNLPLARV